MIETIHIPDNKEYRELKDYIDSLKGKKGAILFVLYKAQELFGYLPPEVQAFISKEMNIPLSQIYGVITFYHFFRTQPVGKNLINVCLGTACYVKGSEDILKALSKELKIKTGETTSDRLFTLTTARCFGACGLAPVMAIGTNIYGRLNGQKAINLIREIKEKELKEKKE
ncbi:MAG: NADH-quinone oxidoreductase subunit NuoE family protein [Caldisericia bacterium]